MPHFPFGRLTAFAFRGIAKVIVLQFLFTSAFNLSFAQRPTYGKIALPSPLPHHTTVTPPRSGGRTALADQKKTVRFVYLVPADSTIKPAYILSIKNAARHLQQWYRDQLGDDLSFSLTDAVVEVHHSTHPSSWYNTNPDADWAGEWKFWFNAVNDALSMAGGTFEDPNYFWIIYTDAFPVCPMLGGGGLSQVAAMDANDLRGLTGQSYRQICNEVVPNYSPCRYVGGLGHELGHAFGLPHPPGCDDRLPTCDYGALMFTGYIDYPNTYFSESEKTILRSSPFISRISGSVCPIDCASLNREYALTSSQHVSICPGAGYFAGGQLQTTTGTYVDRLTSKGGCDSIRTTYLTILPVSSSTRNVAICQGATFFAGGALQSQAGTYIDTFVSKAGCDSTVTTQLAILPTYTITRDVSICQGETYFAGGTLRSISGTYRDTFATRKGCDSVIITQLKVLPTYESTRDVSICAGDSYVVAGIPRSTPGFYRDVLSSRSGCDSVVVINLKVVAALTCTHDVSICNGTRYFAGGAMQNEAGTYTDVFQSTTGCDSVIVTHLTILPEYNSSQTVTICDQETYFAGGVLRSESGTYTDIFKSKNGCDSVVTTCLQVIPKFEIPKNVSICSGDRYYAGGAWQTNPGVYTDVFRSRHGCDSVIAIHLDVLPAYADTVEVNTCEGEPYFAGGASQSSSGFYADAFKSKTGCDSVIVTKLIVGICMSVVPGEDPAVSVYPVPTNGSVHVQAGRFHHVVVLSAEGRPVLTSTGREMDIGALPNGTYYLKIYEDPKRYVVRRVELLR